MASVKIPAAMLLALLWALPAAADLAAVLAAPGRLPADVARDARDRPDLVIPLLAVGPGDRVADIFGGAGYYSEIIGALVTPAGEVLLHNNRAYLDYVAAPLAARFDGREVVGVVRHDREPAQLDLGDNRLDAAFIILSYHDLYYTEEGWPPIDRGDFMAQILRALKPGGRFLIVDHRAAAGAGVEVTQQLHRIDAAMARADIERVGFRYLSGSEALRNPEDDHRLNVFDPAIRGRTDRFIQVYEKPAP